jgi:DNA-binding NarL/FixJ family response regulator
MNVPQHDPQLGAIPSRACAKTDSCGLLLSRDLIFTTKIKETAAELGHRIEVARDAKTAEALIAEQRPQVVLIDLTAGDLCARAALDVYRNVAGPHAWLVAFGPHVDPDSLAEAEAAGCQVAMPRSKFASELPKLLRHYFSHSP